MYTTVADPDLELRGGGGGASVISSFLTQNEGGGGLFDIFILFHI